MSKNTYKTPVLKIKEVASWWLPTQLKEIKPAVKAQLPALQRGFVWKPQQVERLWDSLVQGFPIGSLLLSRVHGKNTTKGGKGSDGEIKKPTHILLDGQQRVTSIALGFKDIWSSKGNEHWASLWVDLDPSDEASDCRFDFRMITKSHPWGYKRSDPSKTISSSDASKAMAVFRELLDDDNIKPHELPLDKVFPWDAVAPIPVALLILAIQESEGNEGAIGETLLEKLKATELYSSNKDNEAIKKRQDKTNEKIQEGISNGNSHFSKLVHGVLNALLYAEIPAPVLCQYLGGGVAITIKILFSHFLSELITLEQTSVLKKLTTRN